MQQARETTYVAWISGQGAQMCTAHDRVYVLVPHADVAEYCDATDHNANCKNRNKMMIKIGALSACAQALFSNG